MKKILSLISVVVLAVSYAQDNATPINLKSGKYEFEANVESFVQEPDFTPFELINDTYYRIIQFSDIPTIQEKEILSNAGIELLQYLPKNAFYAAVQSTAELNLLQNHDVLSVNKILSEFKLSKELLERDYPEWALFGDEVGINAVYHEGISKDYIHEFLFEVGAKITDESFPEVVSIQIPLANLYALYENPAFYYFETFYKPGEPEDYQDVANHRTNWVQNQSTGLNYTGEGVFVVIHDDGLIGPHIDYQGRISNETGSNNGDHGDHCSGILMGAGNLDPEGVGNAPGAFLQVYGSANSNYGLVPLLVNTEGLVITSKSYGNGDNTGYTGLCRTLDQQCHDYESLVHVFSAGNSGTSNFGYGAGAGWGNITGGHKQAKNVLAVGNLSANDVLSSSSSRGPAEDGRIKPDICAVGTNVYSTVDVNDYDEKSGTSMACPAVAGCLAVLYEAYRDMNGGQDPNAALINGAVLNSADDLGNPGPDFKHGWGRINVRRAYDILEQGNYQYGEITHGVFNQHTIEIPANTRQLKVMVYWTDYEGSPSASTALVNDINMTMIGPDLTGYLPLVLDPTPNAGILDMDAQPGIDDLNNVEQIVIDYPMAGTYTVSLEGFSIPEGPQKYYIVYEPIVQDFVLTFPVGGESVNPGEGETIRWDALGDQENFSIEYSADDGVTWNTINASVPGSWRTFPWLVPGSLVSGEAIVRITRGNEVVQSEHFSIIDQPTNLNVEWACPNSFNLSWSPVNGAIAYEVFLLGDKYMDSVGYTTTTNATIYANTSQTHWVSVRAIGPDNCVGKRAIAIQKLPGQFGCNLDVPAASFNAYCNETSAGTCVRFYDQSLNAGQGAAWEWTFPGGTPSTSNLENPVVCYDTEGYYNVQLVTKNGVGEDTVIWGNFVHIRPAEPLPFMEDFESGAIPADWLIEDDNTSETWKIDPGASAYDIGNNCISFNHFNNDSSETSSRFITEQIHFPDQGLIYELTFDVAYAGDVDSLRVYVTQDCGWTSNLIYSKGGDELRTTGTSATFFVPNHKEWRNEHVTLSEYPGAESINFIFETYSEQGNVIYVDNINVLVSEVNFPGDQVTVFPNPFDNELNVVGLVEGEATKLKIYSATGEIVYERWFDAPGGTMVLNTDFLADGMYIVKIESESKTHKEKLIKGDEN